MQAAPTQGGQCNDGTKQASADELSFGPTSQAGDPDWRRPVSDRSTRQLVRRIVSLNDRVAHGDRISLNHRVIHCGAVDHGVVVPSRAPRQPLRD